MAEIPDNQKVILLLERAKHIQEKYKIIEDANAEGFNIFSILRLDSNELQHSRFLAELLNPKGQHQQESIFLELFCKQFDIQDFNYDYTSLKIENNTEEGRIDIWIEDDKSLIIIENKIYAKDQDKQLFRYYSIAEKKGKVYYLFYLNLWGTAPSDNSKKDLKADEHFKVISYQKNITKWLEGCLKEASLIPIVRETIRQYLNLIKKLTGQSFSQNLIKDMVNILKKDSNYKLITELKIAYEQLKIETQINFWKALESSLNRQGLQPQYLGHCENIEQHIETGAEGIGLHLDLGFYTDYDLKLKIQLDMRHPKLKGHIVYGIAAYKKYNTSKPTYPNDRLSDYSDEIWKDLKTRLSENIKWQPANPYWIFFNEPQIKFNFSSFDDSVQISRLINNQMDDIETLAKEIKAEFDKIMEIDLIRKIITS